MSAIDELIAIASADPWIKLMISKGGDSTTWLVAIAQTTNEEDVANCTALGDTAEEAARDVLTAWTDESKHLIK